MSARCHLDSKTLYQALDLERIRAGYSWRDISRQTGLAPSTFTKLKRGSVPSSNTLCTLLWWLNHPVNGYVTPTLLWGVDSDSS